MMVLFNMMIILSNIITIGVLFILGVLCIVKILNIKQFQNNKNINEIRKIINDIREILNSDCLTNIVLFVFIMCLLMPFVNIFALISIIFICIMKKK